MLLKNLFIQKRGNARGEVGRGGRAALDSAAEIQTVSYKTFRHFEIHNKENTQTWYLQQGNQNQQEMKLQFQNTEFRP